MRGAAATGFRICTELSFPLAARPKDLGMMASLTRFQAVASGSGALAHEIESGIHLD